MKNLLGLVVFAALLAGACKKKQETPAASASGAAPAAPAVDAAAAAAAPAVRADVAAFIAAFDPVNSRLDHVARARGACEQRPALLAAVKAIDKTTPPPGRDAAAWQEAVAALQLAIDETGIPCDEGNIKGIEAQLDSAKKALDGLLKLS